MPGGRIIATGVSSELDAFDASLQPITGPYAGAFAVTEGTPGIVTIFTLPRRGEHHDGDGCDHDRNGKGHKDGDGCEHDRQARG